MELVYLYGIVPPDSPEPPAELRGLEDAPVRLVREGGVAAAVSDLPGAEYGDEALEGHMGDLAWVGERGLAHERVLDWFSEQGPVVPLSLFSLHASDERVRERLSADAERFQHLLDRLRGHREWGVKLWRSDEKLAERIDELSPAVQALSAEMEQAPPGRAFLLGKKRDTLRAEEVKRLGARVAHQVLSALREHADGVATVPLPSPGGAERVLALHAAFLVSEESFPAFQRRLGELAGEFTPAGFEFEFTGPWPPYHFVEPDGR